MGKYDKYVKRVRSKEKEVVEDSRELSKDTTEEFSEFMASRKSEREFIPMLKINSPREVVPVWFLSDVHSFHEDFDMDLFLAYRDWAIENNAYVIALGDLIESCIPTHMPPAMWSQTLKPSDQTDWICEQLAPLKGRILLMLDGNHEARIIKTTSFSPTKIMSERLNAMYGQDGGYIRLVFNNRIAYNLVLFHGGSDSQNPRLELGRAYTSYPDADLVAIGHNHRLFQETHDSFRADGGSMRMGQITGIRTGGFLFYPDYVKKKIGSPTRNGSPIAYFNTGERRIVVDTAGLII